MNPAASSPNVFRRWLDAFVALPDRIKLPLALLVAVLLHGVAFLIAWVWPFVSRLILIILPISPAQPTPTPTPPPKKLEVTLFTPTPPPKIVATPTPTKLPENDEQLLEKLFAQLPPEKQREYIDVEGLARKKNTSKQALLESWRDSVAGSRKRGTGDDPLPTLDGLDNMTFTQLTNKEVSLGKPDEPAEPLPDSASPLFKPKPVKPEAQTTNATPETAATPTPTPTPRPMLVAKATPPPSIMSVIEANADQIPIFLNRRTDPDAPKFLTTKQPDPEPKPTPAPTATPPPKPTPVSTAQPTPSQLPTPTPPDALPKAPTRPLSVIEAKLETTKPLKPKPVPNPGYSPQMRRTRVNGAAMPVGEDGVDSVATPLGRYKKAISAAVGSHWNYEIQKQMSLLSIGEVTASIRIDAKGKVRGFRIVKNTSNNTHALIIEQSVRRAELDPPPQEALQNGFFEYEMRFLLRPPE